MNNDGPMNQQLWTDVDAYVCDQLIGPDACLDAALRTSDEAGLPPYHVSPNQGKFLHLLARTCAAQTILEIGTLGGYSTIWLARSLPPTGRLITLESDASHAEVARTNIARAGFGAVVEIRIGPALDSLSQMAAEHIKPFDLIFIDADKANSANYFKWALRLSRVGSLIVTDNVVRGGDLINGDEHDPNTHGIRLLHELLAEEPRVAATTIQTVGSKGYDGMTFALVTSPDTTTTGSQS